MKRIQKRNGDIVAFDIKKIEVAINKAANAVSFKDFNGGKQLSEKVESILDETFTNTIRESLLEGLYLDIANEYRRALRERNAVDFDDLMVLPLQVLTQDRKLREKERAQIRWPH